MAVSIPAGVADYLKRTTSLLDPAVDSTVMLWVNYTSVPLGPAYNLAYALLDDPGVYTDYITLDVIDGGGVNQEITGTGPLSVSTAFLPTAGVWYHLCWLQFGTSQYLYVNGVEIGHFTLNRAAFTVGFELLGNDTFATGDLKAAYARSWQEALTPAEILTEMGATQAARTIDLFMDTPLVSDLLDDSGNGRNWTEVGTVPFVAGPSLVANSTIFTAEALTAPPPQDITLDMGDGTTAWYSYTPATADEVVLGFWAFYDFTKVDDLQLKVYQGPTSSPVEWPDPGIGGGVVGGDSVPYQIPVTFGTTIYINLSARLASILPWTDDIAISTLPQPTGTVPIGSIAVNDDLRGFPLAMMSGTSQDTVLQFLGEFSASGSGAVMPVTGEIMIDTGNALSGATDFRIYQPDYQTFVSVPYPTHGDTSVQPFVIGTDGASLFYVSSDGGGAHRSIVTSYDTAGTLVDSFDVGAFDIRGGSPNQSNTIFYFVTPGANQPIKRWDMVGGALLANLPTGIANYSSVPDLLVLADETIIWAGHRGGFADLVNQYDSTTGATLNTYTMPASPRAVDHLATAIDDPVSFWVWLHNNDAIAYASTFLNIQASDGTELQHIDAQIYEQGQYGGDFTVAPTSRFGHSNSCPFWITRVAIGPPVPPVPPGEAATYLIRRERIFPHLSSEQFWQFFHSIQFDFEMGVGLREGQGVDPQAMITWSDDGGHTWSNEHWVPLGARGAYARRAFLRKMGRSRDRVFKVAVSDPVKAVLLSAYVNVEKGTS